MFSASAAFGDSGEEAHLSYYEDPPSFVADSLPPQLPGEAQGLLDHLLETAVLTPRSANGFLRECASNITRLKSEESLGKALVQGGYLTSYQLDRVMAGTTHGLVLGNYRVLDRLGAGAMGVVFLAEHRLMKRRVAVKVLPIDCDCPTDQFERFYSEMRVLADFHHPHIVLAFDAGQVKAPNPGSPELLYLVLELVPGGDLEAHIEQHGPADISTACEWVRQAASGLQEAHDHHVIHRDVKPSNLLLDQQRRVKVVDFGLVRQFCSQLTDARSLVGTLEFMAPEQSCDPSNVDERADVYGLGATLFWLLTKQMPFPRGRSVAESLRLLQGGKPRRARELRKDVPEELDAIIARMLDRDPSARFRQPLEVMNVLLPFCQPRSSSLSGLRLHPEMYSSLSGGKPNYARPLEGRRVLIVDDESSIRSLSRSVLEPLGCECLEAADGEMALRTLGEQRLDLMLLDLNLPDMDGYEICRRLRGGEIRQQLKIIVISGRGGQNELADSLPMGADDYIPKPFGIKQLAARVERVLQTKREEEHSTQLLDQLHLSNNQLESSLAARSEELRQTQEALLSALYKMAENGDGETPGHFRRLQAYTRQLAGAAASLPGWQGVVNSVFLDYLERSVPLHDLGKIAIPRHILLKPGSLSTDERRLVQMHTLIGDRMLESLRAQHGSTLTYLGMASIVVRSHHERFDGAGYPDGLVGAAIPHAARLVSVADVYDALRRKRLHKGELSHEASLRIMMDESPGQFDPDLLTALKQCEREFSHIYDDIPT